MGDVNTGPIDEVNLLDVTDDTIVKYEEDGLISKEIVEQLKQRIEEARYWDNAFNGTTPGDASFFREGSDGKDYEYVKQFYVIKKLNEKYPGWQIKKWKVWYEQACRTWVFKGNLHVKYIIPRLGLVKRKIPGVGGAFVHAKSNDT